MENAQLFRLEEFKALRAEILYQIAEIDRIKFWVAAAFAAYYSFVATKFVVIEADNRIRLSGPWWMWAAPIVLPIVGEARLLAHIEQLGIFAEYIKSLEKSFGTEGWEHFYAQHRSSDIVWYFDQFYFVVLAVFGCAIVVLQWRTNQTPSPGNVNAETRKP